MRRLKRYLTAAIAAAAGMAWMLAALPVGASAAPELGPNNAFGNFPGNGDAQTANVPYLAWDGELVRLVWCGPHIVAPYSGPGADGSAQVASFRLHEWTGLNQNQQPQPDGADASNFAGGTFNPASAAFFTPSSKPQGWGCVKADYKSSEPGLARISLNVYKRLSDGNRVPEASTDFLVIWLSVNRPTIHEAAAGDFPQSNPINVRNFLGDPAGDGIFVPDTFSADGDTGNSFGNNGLLQLKVTGSFPVNGDPATAPYWTQPGTFPGGTVTLPTDWATLASVPGLATAEDNASTNTAPVSNNGDPKLWDIHGTLGVPDTHVAGAPGHPFCSTQAGTSGGLVDAVDNCNGGTTQFSRVFGDLTNDNNGTAGLGPYDPERGPATLLSGGQGPNADSAPMPAMQLNVSIAPNSGAKTDISGVGEINGTDKQMVYSRDFLGTPSPHNLYMPFYNAFIPATAAWVNEASGVDGPPQDNTGNFPGFLNTGNPYHYWDKVWTFAQNAAADTGCLHRSDRSPSNYQTPGEQTSIALYTDERGEAYATYSPENGFYFDSLINANPSIVNGDGGCDLQSLNGKSIGISSIDAKPVYPFGPVSQITTASPSVTKTVISKWSKTLSVFGKGTSAQDANTRIFVAQAVDINGEPFAGETVCFHAQATGATNPGVSVFRGTINGADPALRVDGSPTANPPGFSSEWTCVTTDANGLAAVAVTDTLGDKVDVFADFTAEKIVRDLTVNYGSPGPGSPGPGSPGPGSPPPPINNIEQPGASPGTTKALANNGGPGTRPTVAPSGVVKVSPASSAGARGPRVRMARVVSSRNGRHYLVVRVASKHKQHVRIRVSEYSKSGRVLRTVASTIRTNRTVKLGIPWSKGVTKLHLDVL
jgi:hypothetical protein